MVNDHNVALKPLESVTGFDKDAREFSRKAFLHCVYLGNVGTDYANSFRFERILLAVVLDCSAQAYESLDQCRDSCGCTIIHFSRNPRRKFDPNKTRSCSSPSDCRIEIDCSGCGNPKRAFTWRADRSEIELAIKSWLHKINGILDQPPRHGKHHPKNIRMSFNQSLGARDMRTGPFAPPSIDIAGHHGLDLARIAYMGDLACQTGYLMISIVR
jgi:hypothetical protein